MRLGQVRGDFLGTMLPSRGLESRNESTPPPVGQVGPSPWGKRGRAQRQVWCTACLYSRRQM